MGPFVTVPEQQKPFDVGSNLVRPYRQKALAQALQLAWRAAERTERWIVTDSVKRLYQNTPCFGPGGGHKIHFASNGKAINNW